MGFRVLQLSEAQSRGPVLGSGGGGGGGGRERERKHE